jgi:hypothetical protein
MADVILQSLSPMLEAMYAEGGRPSIPPERLLKATILMALYTVRSERQFCEQLNYNLLFRWFLDMDMTEVGWEHSSFTLSKPASPPTNAPASPTRSPGCGTANRLDKSLLGVARARPRDTAPPMNLHHDKLETALARLARRVPDHGFESLEPHEQVALLAYSSHSAVTNGGFKRFYEGPMPLSRLVAAFRDLKLNSLANAALATAAAFPSPALAEDPAARRDHLENLDTAKQDYAFFRLSNEELLDAITAYWKRIEASSARQHKLQHSTSKPHHG